MPAPRLRAGSARGLRASGCPVRAGLMAALADSDLGAVEVAGPGGPGEAAERPPGDSFAEAAVAGRAAGGHELAAAASPGVWRLMPAAGTQAGTSHTAFAGRRPLPSLRLHQLQWQPSVLTQFGRTAHGMHDRAFGSFCYRQIACAVRPAWRELPGVGAGATVSLVYASGVVWPGPVVSD
jgi:hypothetical protein